MNNNVDILVSVVIPTFGRCSMLERALKSLENQTYKHIQLIIVDDNENKDEISSQIKELFYKYCDKFINSKLIANNKNIGSARARNLGINNSDGQYITFLDDDDYYDENKILHQLNKMLEEDSDVSYTQIELIDESGKSFRAIKRANIEEAYKKGEIMEYHFINHITATSTFMFKTDALKQINGFELKENDMGDEFYLTYKVIENNLKMSFLSEILVFAEVHQNEGMSVSDKRLDGEKRLYNFKKEKSINKSNKFKRFLKARYYLTLTIFWLKRKKYFRFFKCGVVCFFTAPIQIVNYVLKNK